MKRTSYLARYFRSYLLIALCPVALFILYFGLTAHTSLRAEIDNGYYAAFSQFANSLDQLLSRAELVAGHLSDSGLDIQALRDDPDAVYPSASLTQALDAYEDQLQWNTPVVLFVRGVPQVYTSQGPMSYQDYQRSVAALADLDLSGFFTAISTVTKPTVHCLVQASQPGSAMALLYPIPTMQAVPAATLCFLVDAQVLGSMLANCITGLEGNLYLFSNIYQEVFRLEALPQSGTPARLLGVGVQSSGDSVVMRSVLQNGGLSASFVSPRSVFYRQLDKMRRSILLASLAILLLAVAVAFLMSRRTYSPLRRLVRGIGVPAEASVDNELELIQAHMDAVYQRNNELDDQLSQQQPVVMEACLTKLMQGKLASPGEADFHLRCAGIDLDGRACFALLVGVQGGPAAECDAQLDNLRLRLRGPLPGGGHAYVPDSDVDGLLPALIVCPPAGESDPRSAMARALLSSLAPQPPLRLMAGAGCLCHDPMQLHDSCMEALAVVRELLPGSNSDFACYDQAESQHHGLSFPVLDCALLTQSLKQADRQMACKALDKIMDVIRRTDSLLYAQCLCFDVINNVLRTIQALQPSFSSPQVHALCAFQSIEAFQHSILQLIEAFCQSYGDIRESRSSSMREELIGYVAEHVFQYDFGLDQIAEAFHLSQSYLSRFYKQETGFTFTQYVTNLRLDRAKRLLAETDLPLKEIVVQVGYIDTASFARKFKSCEGVTPGQWRETYRA